MSLKDSLKKTLAERYGITTDEQLLAAVENIDLDLGIFTTTKERRPQTCKEAS